MRALDPKALAREDANREPPWSPLWVKRAAVLELLSEHREPMRAGRSVWAASEPWILAVRELAADPAVLLAELPDWLSLLDRHSTVQLQESADGTAVLWQNTADAPPHAQECALRLGALVELLAPPGRPRAPRAPRVRHPQCAAKPGGAPACVFAVERLSPRPDRAHARALREARLLSAALQGREELARRFARVSPRGDPFPDVRELRAVRRFMEELEDAVMVFDRDLALIDANHAALAYSAMSLSEMRGQSARDLMSPDSFQSVSRFLPMLLERGWARGLVIDARTRHGWVKLELSARVSEDRQVIVCIGRDIGQHLELERELAERNRQLAEQNERIAAADRLKSEFLANVSHELTTPLTCIKGFSKLLLGDLEAELGGREPRIAAAKRVEFLRVMQRESERTTELIRGLLELSKIESGVVTLDRARVWLNTIVRETLLLLKPRLDERSLEVEQRLDDSLPPALLDPDRMKQVVLNLLDNAIKFSEPRSTLSIQTQCPDGRLRLVVRNPSSELGDSDLARIFERFVQRDGSFSRSHGGVGLGLNLVRAIVELHGGRVWAQLPDPGWVEFVAEIPVAFS